MTLTKEEEEYITKLENDNVQLASVAQQGQSYGASPYFGNQNKQNIVELQLDLSSDIPEIERALRCDVIVTDDKGNEYWVRNPDKSQVFMNDKGVSSVIRLLKLLVNRNKILSNYREDVIHKKVKMISVEISMEIYNNDIEYGIDNEYKRNLYPLIVLALDDIIDAAYRRAINGEAARTINSTKIIQQNENMNPYGMAGMYPGMPEKKGFFSKLNPFNLFR